MSQVRDPNCDFDHWEDGTNERLKGGYVLGVTDHLFAYAFNGPDGLFQNAFIARFCHGGDMSLLLSGYPAELAVLYDAALKKLGGAEHNVYGNIGLISGVRVENHPHLHVLRRRADQPSSGMGMGLLVSTHNRVVGRIRELAEVCTDAAVAAELRRLAS